MSCSPRFACPRGHSRAERRPPDGRNSILDRAGVGRTLAAPDAEVARRALIERLLAMRATQVEEETAEGYEVDVCEAVEAGQMETGRLASRTSGGG